MENFSLTLLTKVPWNPYRRPIQAVNIIFCHDLSTNDYTESDSGRTRCKVFNIQFSSAAAEFHLFLMQRTSAGTGRLSIPFTIWHSI